MIKDSAEILNYMKQAVHELNVAGEFPNGWKFKPTQEKALKAYDEFLNREDLSDKEKLKGFFEIPTGIGKTALFAAIVTGAHRIAAEHGQDFTTMIIVPTNLLVDQTVDSINLIAPDFADQIGLYDKDRKDLEKPITVITYDSWTTLLEKGKISAQNTDLLISDEAHRGTSERRIDNIFEAYDNQVGHTTARLAFTATASFDADKTVEKTHHNLIYQGKIKDAVKDGELAEYISTQFYIIRVNPKDKEYSDEFNSKATNGTLEYAMRKKAWSKRMHALLRDGRDSITQDLLSDNKVGFFAADTAHANSIEKMLNGDAELQKRAKEQGLDGVAVAIHSNMPESLQKQRMKDYLAGKYMAVIGDSKFKEGFDDPRMKVIFDFPRNSLVDKAQILGRGARQWFNELKNRPEGMTFIDTVVYVGSKDPKQDKKLRDKALLKSIRAKDVLEDDFLLKDGKKIKPRKPATGKSEAVFVDDPDVEEYTSLEDLHLIETDYGELKAADDKRKKELKSYIKITDEEFKKLRSELDRTLLGGLAIFNNIKNPPEGTSAVKLSYIMSGEVKSAPKGWVDIVLETYKDQPDMELITQAKKDKLKSAFDRTLLGGTAIFKHIKNPPKSMTAAKLDNIISNRRDLAPKGWVDIMLEAYKDRPDMELITQAKKDELKSAFDRTLLGGAAIFKHIKNPPKGMTAVKLNRFMSKMSNSAPKGWVDIMLEAYKDQPDMELITQAKKDKLKSAFDRTLLRGAAIFKHIKNPPEGMTATKLISIMLGDIKSTPKGWVDLMLGAYADQPSMERITQAEKVKLKSESERTSLSGTAIFKHIKNPPEGMTASKFNGLISGHHKSARQGCINAMFDAYAAQPDKIKPTPKCGAGEKCGSQPPPKSTDEFNHD